MFELPQRSAVQLNIQLRLTNQDDLQQLFPIGLQVRQQANRFKRLFTQVLRFVNQQGDDIPPFNLVEQEFIELLMHRHASGSGFEIKIAQDSFE